MDQRHGPDQLITAPPPGTPDPVGQLAASQAALHRLPVPDWARTGWAVADKRLALARYVVAEGWGGPLADGLDRTERIVPLLEVAEPVICHGDFHPRNLLVDGDTVRVIDWTDAGIGDRHGDVARTEWTFRFAAIAITGSAGRAVDTAREYLSRYRGQLPIDVARLRLWMPLQHLNAWAMAVAGEHGFFGASPAGTGSRITAWAKEQFWRSIDELP